MQQYPGWEDFYQLPISQKLPIFTKNDQIFDIIYAQQYDRTTLEELFTLANSIRQKAASKEGLDHLRTILSDKRALLLFVQPSTRTFLSFLNACQILGMQTSDIRDSSTSSEVKGESAEDSVRTFSSYVDLIIVRHFDEGFAEKAAWVLNTHANRSIPVINGGSGKDQHPTQALLDMYTLDRAFKDKHGIDQKRIAMIGDLKRGRTVRSLIRLLSLYNNISFDFISPPEFKLKDDILEFLSKQNISFTQSDDLEGRLPKADAIYATRIQDEHDTKGESKNIDYQRFDIQEKHLELLQPHAAILHPFPRRNEIDVNIDRDNRAHYWKQARNGMWIRAAAIAKLFNREHLI